MMRSWSLPSRRPLLRVFAVLLAFALPSVPVAACDLARIAERLSWAEDLRDYVDLWMELGITDEAASDLEQLPAVLAEAKRLLEDCPSSKPVRQMRADVAALEAWSRRAMRLIGD